MSGDPRWVTIGTPKTVDEALALVDRIFDDRIRAFITSLVVDATADGATVDPDWLEESVGRQRAEYALVREQMRRAIAAEFPTIH